MPKVNSPLKQEPLCGVRGIGVRLLKEVMLRDRRKRNWRGRGEERLSGWAAPEGTSQSCRFCLHKAPLPQSLLGSWHCLCPLPQVICNCLIRIPLFPVSSVPTQPSHQCSLTSLKPNPDLLQHIWGLPLPSNWSLKSSAQLEDFHTQPPSNQPEPCQLLAQTTQASAVGPEHDSLHPQMSLVLLVLLFLTLAVLLDGTPLSSLRLPTRIWGAPTKN